MGHPYHGTWLSQKKAQRADPGHSARDPREQAARGRPHVGIPFLRNVQNRQIHSDRRQVGGFQGLGENGKYKWVGVSFGGDENVLEVQ